MDHTAHFLFLALVGCGGTESAIAIDAGHPDVREASRDVDLVLQNDEAGTDAAVGPIPGCNGIEATSAGPTYICHGTLTIEGKNFQPTPAVLMSCGQGVTVLGNVTFVSSTKITATVPPPMNVLNRCDIIVVNPDSCEAVLPDAFTYWCEGPPGPQ